MDFLSTTFLLYEKSYSNPTSEKTEMRTPYSIIYTKLPLSTSRKNCKSEPNSTLQIAGRSSVFGILASLITRYGTTVVKAGVLGEGCSSA